MPRLWTEDTHLRVFSIFLLSHASKRSSNSLPLHVNVQVPATPLPSHFERPQQIPTSVSDVPSTPPKLRLATQAQTIAAKPRKEFSIHYDKLVIAVGCYSQSIVYNIDVWRESLKHCLVAFGVPGVKEYGYFLKDVRDARAIRSRILECMPCHLNGCHFKLMTNDYFRF